MIANEYEYIGIPKRANANRKGELGGLIDDTIIEAAFNEDWAMLKTNTTISQS